MINNRPNIFEFATKELSQDAVFCYILDCLNDLTKKSIATEFLNLIQVPYVDEIQQLEIKRQQDNIDIKAIVTYKDGTRKYIIIEDKVYSSIHDNQLQRYKDETIKREQCSADNIIGIYFRIGKPQEWERKACKEADFSILDYESFLTYIEAAATADLILDTFCDFFKQRAAYFKMIDTCAFSALDNTQFQEIIGSRYGQRKITQWMMQKIFDESYSEKKLYDVNNFGSPCTQYEFIFDRKTTAAEWDLPESEFPQRDYCCFFRVDRNAKGWYISIRQYFRNGATDKETEASNQKRVQLLKVLGIKKDDASNRKASKEKTLVLFQIDSIEKILQILPQLQEAVSYLLNTA